MSRSRQEVLKDIKMLSNEVKQRNSATWRHNNSFIYWTLKRTLDECMDEYESLPPESR